MAQKNDMRVITFIATLPLLLAIYKTETGKPTELTASPQNLNVNEANKHRKKIDTPFTYLEKLGNFGEIFYLTLSGLTFSSALVCAVVLVMFQASQEFNVTSITGILLLTLMVLTAVFVTVGVYKLPNNS